MANNDFLQPDRQIVGLADTTQTAIAVEVLEMLPPAPFEAVVRASTAAMIKYATNCFLALKVTSGNEMFDLCEAAGVDLLVASLMDSPGAKRGAASSPAIPTTSLSRWPSG